MVRIHPLGPPQWGMSCDSRAGENCFMRSVARLTIAITAAVGAIPLAACGGIRPAVGPPSPSPTLSAHVSREQVLRHYGHGSPDDRIIRAVAKLTTYGAWHATLEDQLSGAT